MPPDIIEEVLTEVGTGDGGNKAQLIRNALELLGDDIKPAEVVEWIERERGIKVTAAYVSLIKTQTKKVAQKQQPLSAQVYLAAKSLIRAAGGVAQAKAALNFLDGEREFVSALRERYMTLLAETEQMLGDGKVLKQKERRELVSETRRIRKLLASLSEVENTASVCESVNPGE